MIAILDPAIKYMFRKFDPINRMIVARDTGLLNPYFDVEKSQMIALYDFASCGALPGDTPETFPDEEFTQQEWEKPIAITHQPELKYDMDESELIDLNKSWIPEAALKLKSEEEKPGVKRSGRSTIATSS